jgi:hypothetical protein
VNLAETARVTRAGAQLEDATFGLLGAWVPSVPEPAAKVLLAEHALHHAWHASLWRERVPDLDGLVREPTAVTDTPFARELAFVEELARDGPVDTPERLRAVHAVFAPLRLESYGALLAMLAAPSDGPVIRALTLIVADQERDRRAGEELLLAAPVAGRRPGDGAGLAWRA